MSSTPSAQTAASPALVIGELGTRALPAIEVFTSQPFGLGEPCLPALAGVLSALRTRPRGGLAVDLLGRVLGPGAERGGIDGILEAAVGHRVHPAACIT
jgi:hypothetical protein